MVLFLVAALLSASWPTVGLRAQESPQATPAQAALRVYLPLIATSVGLPSFTLIYPEAGATVGGTSIIAARALVATSVTSISLSSRPPLVERYVQQDGAVTDATRRLPDQSVAATGATTRLPQSLEAVTGATTRLDGIYCPSCGTENAPEAGRCRECGIYLQARACPACGVSNPATANFCMRCGGGVHAERAVNE